MASSTLLNVSGQQAQTNSDADAALAGLANAGSIEPAFALASSSSSRAKDITGTASLPQAATAGTTEPQAAVFSGPAAPAPPTYTYITPTAAGPNLSNNAAALSAPDQSTLQLPMGADSAPAAVTVAHRPDVWAPGVWVGELQVSPGPLSVVTLKMSAAGDILTGDAIYWDAQQSKMRSVMIQPVQPTASIAAASSTPAQQLQEAAASSSSSTSRAWQQQQQRAAGAGQLHAVFEYEQPDRPQAALPVARTVQRMQGSAALFKGPAEGRAVDSAPQGIALGLGGSSGSSSSSSSSTARRRQLKRKLQQQQPPPAAGTDNSGSWQVDVLVAVTPAAAAAGGGIDALATAAALAVAKANKAYVDSSVSVRLNLTAVRQVTYTEPPQAPGNSPSQILDDVTSGKIPEIQNLRNELSADLVLLFNNDSTTCGLSWGYNIQSDAYFNADHGYATIMSGCWYGHVLAHEVTHTLGCGHLWENEHMYGDTLPYGFGYMR
uniref:Uncharacterized protein n=1 Tax=Tetradesmus obliquus TaxID=3088 RepID=A0A383VQE3_TETOB|eukprot:jgi/Sobl393_1/14697/SZX67113.1